MKALVRFRTAGAVETEVIEGHRITSQLRRRNSKVTVYDKKGRIIRDVIYRKADRIERLMEGL